MTMTTEKVQTDSQNANLRQRAELLLRLEVLMSDKERRDLVLFPRWIYWYQPLERTGEPPAVKFYSLASGSSSDGQAKTAALMEVELPVA